MPLYMATYDEHRIEQILARIETAENIDERDRELLKQFVDRAGRQQYSVARTGKILDNCKTLAGVSEKYSPDELPDAALADALEDREAAETFVDWINDTYDNEETNCGFRVTLRVFGGIMTDGPQEEKPDSIEWISSGTSRSYDPSPDPAEMLHWEDDVVPMIEATMNPRDAALIAVAWDSGARTSELLDLRIGDVTDHDYGLQITVDGKVGQRSITLIPSVPYMNRWLQEHPRRDDATAPVWCNIETHNREDRPFNRGDSLSYHMCRKIPLEAAKRADVNKPVTFTNFRKSSASYLASQGVNQAVLEDHHGWKTGSNAAARYISVFSDASDREIAGAHGLDVEEEEPEPIAAITCPRCEKETPRHERFCMWCRQALDHGAVEEMEATQQQERRQLLGFAKEHPELIDQLEELEPLVEALGGDPDVIETARRFVDETES